MSIKRTIKQSPLDLGFETHLLRSGKTVIKEFNLSHLEMNFLVAISVFKGNFDISFNQSPYFRASAGDVVIVPSGTRLKMKTKMPSAFLWLHIQATLFNHLVLNNIFSFPKKLSKNSTDEAQKLIEKIEILAPEEKLQHISIKRGCLYHLISILLSEAKYRPEAKEIFTGMAAMQPVLQFINQNLHRDINRKMLARIMHLSISQFTRVFTKAIGVSPMAYVLNTRVLQAQALLMKTELPLQEIAERLGFCDAFHLSKQFKAKTGKTPHKYRLSMKELTSHYSVA